MKLMRTAPKAPGLGTCAQGLLLGLLEELPGELSDGLPEDRVRGLLPGWPLPFHG